MFRAFLRKILKLFSLKRGTGGEHLTCFSIFADFLMKAPEGGGRGDEYHASHPAPKSRYCFGNLDWLLLCKKETLRILPQQFQWQLLNRVRKRSQVWKNTALTFYFFHKTCDRAMASFWLFVQYMVWEKNLNYLKGELFGLFSYNRIWCTLENRHVCIEHVLICLKNTNSERQ